MSNKHIVFSDRIVGLSVQGGLVRIDLAAIAGQTKNKDGKDAFKMEVTHQIVMPLEGFVQGFSAQQKLVKEIASRAQKRGGKKADAADAPAA